MARRVYNGYIKCITKKHVLQVFDKMRVMFFISLPKYILPKNRCVDLVCPLAKPEKRAKTGLRPLALTTCFVN